jgi:hypothetical protein
MWEAVQSTNTPTTGINHWVYSSNQEMFAGVELSTPQRSPISDRLEPPELELKRSLKHVQVGPYQALPQEWTDLKVELAARDEIIGSPSLEIEGHPCDDPAELETTILVCLC